MTENGVVMTGPVPRVPAPGRPGARVGGAGARRGVAARRGCARVRVERPRRARLVAREPHDGDGGDDEGGGGAAHQNANRSV